MTPFTPNAYGAIMIGGILLTAWLWGRMTSTGERRDGRFTMIYLGGLVGALLGAKLAYLFAEGWAHRDEWVALLAGRSITGALLGGYAGVEIAKRCFSYRRATGDVFAVVVPLSLVLGRIGCILGGCCPGVVCPARWWTVTDAGGVARWPAAHAELVFNAIMLAWALLAARRGWVPGNRFHVYLVAYGVFRFAHEFARDDARIAGPIGGYHVLAIAIAALGVWRFRQRRGRSGGRQIFEVGVRSDGRPV